MIPGKRWAGGVTVRSAAELSAVARAAVTVGAAKMPNPSFPLGRGNPDAKDGNLTRRRGLVLPRKRPIATPGMTRSPASLITLASKQRNQRLWIPA